MLPEDLCADAHDHARHVAFARRALSVPVAAAFAAPLLVALQGALPLWQVAALGSAILPLGSLLLLQRAQIFPAQVLLVLSLSALAVNLSVALGFSLAVFAILMIAAVEAVALERHRVPAIAAVAALATLLFVSASGTAPVWPNLVLAALACGYVVHMTLQMHDQAAHQKRMAQEARIHHAALEEASGDVRLHVTRAGAVSFVDPQVRSKLHLSRRDLSGRGFFERILLADRPVLIKALGDCLARHELQIVQVQFHLRDEESPRARFVTPVYRPFELRLSALAQDEILVLAREVAAIPLESASQADARLWKEQLIANVSHELRTPLNAIIGFSDLLATRQEPADEAQQREYAAIIHASGQHLLAVVNSILDMSQIESGAFPMEPEAFAFAALVDECCDMMKLKADAAGIVLRRQVQRDARDMVADRRACKQVLINLLSNAIKFTPAGGSVTVHAQQAGQDLLLAVSDTGIGIAPEYLPRLGDPFFQAHTGAAREAEGTGLGLSVVKGLVGLHGGSISVESAPQQGTCVTIRLPIDCRPFKAGNGKSADIHSAPRQAGGSLPDMMMVKKIA